MYLQRQSGTQRKQQSVGAFGGYRHDHRAGAERFYAMENLSSDGFPLLLPRKRRGVMGALSAPNGLWARDKLLFADGASLYYGGARVGAVSNTPKTFVNMGARIVIWPDKLLFDPEQGTLTPLGASYTSTAQASFTLCSLQAADYTYTAANEAPAAPESGAMWLDTSETPNVLKRYSASLGMWTAVSASYVKIACTGIGAAFSEYDGVTIAGCTNAALNGSFLLYAVQPDYILISATIAAAFTQASGLTVARSIPDFDFICEHDNRLWGCSNARHEIACCKLGDPGNWSCYMGISTDSYTLSIGSEGDFTACCAYGGSVLFFKEDRILKILGSKPANFQLSPAICPGVACGSHKSLATVGGVLYFHARIGVCAYNGALSETVSDDLCESFTEAVAGGTDTKYYISMKDAANASHLFVYDAAHDLWHREDDARILDFAALHGRLYMLKACTGGAELLCADGEEGTLEEPVRWYLETGELCVQGHMRPQKLVLRVQADFGARIRVRLRYNGGGYEEAALLHGGRKRPMLIPLRLRRCDSLTLRLEGTGDFKLHALTFYYEEDSPWQH